LQKRISEKEAEVLLKEADLLRLGTLANSIKKRLHPKNVITYVVDRNINYTNVCVSKCLFCAFHKDLGAQDAYIISKKDLYEKINETIKLGGTQILLQGGIHPELNLDFYTDMLKYIKDNFSIHIHGFSPPEISYIAKKSLLTVRDTLLKLIEAGLNSIPGGGAEILSDKIRGKVSPNKCGKEEWLNVMRTAHKLGLKSSATMMFGHMEKTEHIIEHLKAIRDLQDETGGFTAFIPWTFQPDNTKIKVEKATAVEYLKVLSLSRIFLDNIKNIQASWVTQGDKIAQTALFFGANDLGSTMIEENVVAAAGVKFMLPKEEIIRLIKEAGFIPAQRDCFYNIIDTKKV